MTGKVWLLALIGGLQGHQRAQLAVEKFDWPTLKVTDRRLVQSPSRIFFEEVSLFQTLLGFSPRCTFEINPINLSNISTGVSGFLSHILKVEVVVTVFVLLSCDFNNRLKYDTPPPKKTTQPVLFLLCYCV